MIGKHKINIGINSVTNQSQTLTEIREIKIDAEQYKKTGKWAMDMTWQIGNNTFIINAPASLKAQLKYQIILDRQGIASTLWLYGFRPYWNGNTFTLVISGDGACTGNKILRFYV